MIIKNIKINKKWKIVIAMILIAIIISSVVYIIYKYDNNGVNQEDQELNDEDFFPDRNDNTDDCFEEPIGESNIIIENIKGGIGVKATIKNTGDASAIDIDWLISISRSGILRNGKEIKQSAGVIPILAPGEESEIKTGMIFGIGKIEVKITADEKELNATGTQLLIFTIIK